MCKRKPSEGTFNKEINNGIIDMRFESIRLLSAYFLYTENPAAAAGLKSLIDQENRKQHMR